MLAPIPAYSGCSDLRFQKRKAKILKYIAKKSRRNMNSEQQKLECFHE